MPRIHPKPDVVQGLIRLLPEGRRRVLRHTRDCPVCRSRGRSEPAAPRPAGRRKPGQLLLWKRSEDSYGLVVDRVLGRLRERLSDAAREQEAAPALLAELARHPAARRSMLSRNSARFHTLPFVHATLCASREATGKSAQQSQEWAELALELSDLLDPERYGVRVIEDARARSWAAIANARRIAGDLLAAERAFQAADAHLRQGTRDPLERAHVLAYKASLRRAQGWYEEAVSLFRRALSIWLCAGEAQRAAESVISWGLLCEETGDLEQAVRLFHEADPLIRLRIDLRLILMLRHNLIICLMKSGQAREARTLLDSSRDLYKQVGDPGIELRRKWLEGQIATELGELEEAARLLEEVREEFARICNGYEVTRCSLNLALIYVRLRRIDEARRLAYEALFLSRSWRISRQALASIVVCLQVPKST
ncbi:MAG TPA: tetratricopeptide repeat protein [Thermoanaerobaculia bacterium]|nr:tetratricopeptide repeat protein [Thermoanaerobaculia bacterium]